MTSLQMPTGSRYAWDSVFFPPLTSLLRSLSSWSFVHLE